VSLKNTYLFFSLSADQEDRTRDVTLNLLLKCLSFDFAGTSLDEAGEDTGMVQVRLIK
jgi:exportin-7